MAMFMYAPHDDDDEEKIPCIGEDTMIVEPQCLGFFFEKWYGGLRYTALRFVHMRFANR